MRLSASMDSKASSGERSARSDSSLILPGGWQSNLGGGTWRTGHLGSLSISKVTLRRKILKFFRVRHSHCSMQPSVGHTADKRYQDDGDEDWKPPGKRNREEVRQETAQYRCETCCRYYKMLGSLIRAHTAETCKPQQRTSSDWVALPKPRHDPKICEELFAHGRFAEAAPPVPDIVSAIRDRSSNIQWRHGSPR